MNEQLAHIKLIRVRTAIKRLKATTWRPENPEVRAVNNKLRELLDAVEEFIEAVEELAA